MFIPFGIVLGVGILFFYCAWRRASRHVADATGASRPAAGLSGPFWRANFEQPARWLAVRAANARVVQAALNLHRPTACSWEKGLAEAREDKLFICPPMAGWVLVVGSGLPEALEDPDRCYHFLRALSRKLGHVQFFSVSRAVNHHCWALLERGRVFRAYAWAGETLWNQGRLTAAEKEMSMRCFDYAVEQNPLGIGEAMAANCEKVNSLAGRWSIDPGAISPEMWRGQGIVGAFSQSKPH
jgi:hypothetical protein